jgi:hypothetical protein
VTSLLIEHFDPPSSSRTAQALAAAGERAGDVLAGRTVWCAIGWEGGERPAEMLRGRLQGGGPGVRAALLARAGEQRPGLLEAALRGMLAARLRDLYQEDAAGGEEMVGEVEGEDVLVVHDALGAIMAQPARERGAHAVWHLSGRDVSARTPQRARESVVGDALGPGIDAYLMSWRERGSRGQVVERIVAAMPSAGIVAAKEFPARFAGEEPRRLAWRMALAEVVRSDRGECVGGTLRPRPVVAAR